MELMVIEVHGVPCSPLRDRMADQLKLHFLKRRNSGGDVLTVIYPTSTLGLAYVIFESAEVPGVLECPHILEVDNRFYPIRVKKAHLSEVDMPVETTLDLTMFPNPDSVLKILKNNGFDIVQSKSTPDYLQLKGSFLKLKLIRSRLISLQGHEHRLHSRAPLGLHNDSSLGYDSARYSLGTTSSNMDAVSQRHLLHSAPSLSSTYRDMESGGSPRSLQHSHSSYTGRNASSPVDTDVQKYSLQHSSEPLADRWSPLADGASSSSANSSSRLGHTSPLYRDAASGGFPRHLLSSHGHSIGSASRIEDTDVLMQQHVMGNEMLADRRSPLADGASSSANSSSRLGHTSPLYRDSASGGFPSHLLSTHGHSIGSTSRIEDTDVLMQQHVMGNKMLADRRSPLADGASSSANSSSRLGHTSPLYRDSASGGFPSHLLSSHGHSIGSTSRIEDTDVLMQQHVMGNEMLAHRQSPLFDVPPSSTTSISSPIMQHHTSSSDSASGGSLRMRPIVDGDTWARSSHNSPSSSSGGMLSFPVDTDSLNFILTQREDIVNTIEKDSGTEMLFKDRDGFTMVKFLGGNSEKAKTCLVDSIKEISHSLRTQEIHLKKYDIDKQKQILERIQHNKDSGVVITVRDDVVKLVGSPGESFDVMQKILGHNDGLQRGRSVERSSNSRRCSSVPRQYKPTDHARITDPVNQASAPNTYTPSHYQEESEGRKALPIVQGPERTSEKKSQRTRSNSESRDKNRTNREPSIQNMELNQEKKSPNPKRPNILKQLTPNHISLNCRWMRSNMSKSSSKKD